MQFAGIKIQVVEHSGRPVKTADLTCKVKQFEVWQDDLEGERGCCGRISRHFGLQCHRHFTGQ
jgi:hypothetical protein